MRVVLQNWNQISLSCQKVWSEAVCVLPVFYIANMLLKCLPIIIRKLSNIHSLSQCIQSCQALHIPFHSVIYSPFVHSFTHSFLYLFPTTTCMSKCLTVLCICVCVCVCVLVCLPAYLLLYLMVLSPLLLFSIHNAYILLDELHKERER